MPSPLFRRSTIFLGILAAACVTATVAGTLPTAPVDVPGAPAYVSACAIDSDSSGVFTPAITVTDRKPSALTSADVEIDFYDAANRAIGAVIVSPPYGPSGLPFGSIDHATCKVRAARFLDGSSYEPKISNTGAALAPIAGALLGAGAAALIIGANHKAAAAASEAATASATPSTGATVTPGPVGTIVQLARPPASAKPH
jgi:hypothetical protein